MTIASRPYFSFYRFASTTTGTPAHPVQPDGPCDHQTTEAGFTASVPSGSGAGSNNVVVKPAIGGMVPMYLLMSAFNAAPWMKYFAGCG